MSIMLVAPSMMSSAFQAPALRSSTKAVSATMFKEGDIGVQPPLSATATGSTHAHRSHARESSCAWTLSAASVSAMDQRMPRLLDMALSTRSSPGGTGASTPAVK